MIRRPPRSTLSSSSAASDVYKRQYQRRVRGASLLEMMVGEEGGENVVHFEGLDQRVDAVFGGLGGAGDWKLASSVRLDPGHGEQENQQPSQETKQCSMSAFDVDEMEVYEEEEPQVPGMASGMECVTQDSICSEFSQTGSCGGGDNCRLQHVAFDPSKWTRYEIDWEEEETSNATAAALVFQDLRERSQGDDDYLPPVFVQPKKQPEAERRSVQRLTTQLAMCATIDDENEKSVAAPGPANFTAESSVPKEKKKRQYRKKSS
eukprot:TRINITY_DN6026_c0_g2_i3.p1 TRINITY_DN6026_c0_g2~~TRINITY_DN6026_c0_g2_i3.p1  ORF type:complete len:263 (-),score=72.59 TRINITY_DN6026_c0_g2_i3:135-923(-)